MATYFISDLHLSASRPDLGQAFAGFLQNEGAGAERLFILGDFFDAWIGDDDDDAFVASIKAAMKDYTALGTRTYFLHGNRDFLIGERFAQDTGVCLLDEQEIVDLNGRKALIMHGDELCTGDAEYMRFRAMVRSPQWQHQVLSLPLPERRQMAAALRDKSRSLNAIKAEDIMDVTPEEVARVMQTHQVDLLIHGHTHRPAKHALTTDDRPQERWVLGDWHDTGWYIREQDGQMDLVEFPLTH